MKGFKIPKKHINEVIDKLGKQNIHYIFWNGDKFIYDATFEGPAEIEVDTKDWPAYHNILKEIGLITKENTSFVEGVSE